MPDCIVDQMSDNATKRRAWKLSVEKPRIKGKRESIRFAHAFQHFRRDLFAAHDLRVGCNTTNARMLQKGVHQPLHPLHAPAQHVEAFARVVGHMRREIFGKPL